MFDLHNKDCLKVMAGMVANSVDLVATDPPYFQVKPAAWDNQWASQSEFLDWLNLVVAECARVLKPTGSLYLFASPKMSSSIEALIARHLRVENHIVWVKPSGMHKRQNRASLRRYFPATERVIFASSFGGCDARSKHQEAAKVCAPVIDYLRSELDRSGYSQADINEAFGSQMAGHWFGKSQWKLPNEEQYLQLQKLLNGHLRRPYISLKREVDHLLKTGPLAIRRHFDVAGKEWNTDVWLCQPVQYYPGKHPCEKPLSMMDHIITSSSLSGAVVFDPFMGSGTTGVAAIKSGRRFIGCEMDKATFDQAKTRITLVAN